MLSTETLKLYDLLLQLATRTKSIPLDWDNSRSVLKLNPPVTRKRRYLAYLVTALDLVASLALMAGYLHYASVYRMPSRIIPPIVAFIGFICGSIFANTGYTSRSEILVLVNKILQTNQHLKLYFGADKRFDHVFALFFKIYLMVNGAVAGLVFLYFMRPRAHDNLYEFYGGTSILGKSAFSLAMTIFVANKYVVTACFVFIMFSGGFVLQIWLDLMMEFVETGRMTCDEAVSMYNSCRICQRMFQNCLGPVILPVMIFMASSMLVVDISGLILFYLEMSVLVSISLADLAMVLSFALVIGFRLLRASERRSRAFLRLIELHSRNDPYITRRLKGCRLIQLRIGNFFVAKDITILTILALIAENVGSLTIAYRK